MHYKGTLKLKHVKDDTHLEYDVEVIGHNLTLVGKESEEGKILTFFQDNEYDVKRLQEELNVLAGKMADIGKLLNKCKE